MASTRLDLFTLPSYQSRTLNELQRCVNLYPEKTADGWRLVSSPGFSLTWTAPNNQPCGGAYFSSTGQLFALHGTVVYEIQPGLTPTSRGTLAIGVQAFFADNGTQLFIVEATGGAGYTLTMAPGPSVVTAVADADYPAASSVTFQDGYFIVSKDGTGEFYLSALDDGTSWDALDFATAEAKGDILTSVYSNGSTLFLIGKRTIELWYNTGNPQFPFERVSGGIFQFGCEARDSIASLNGNLYFLGNSEGGKGSVWVFEGSTPRKISSEYLETLFQGYNASNVLGCCYQIDGHAFYQLNFTADGKTFIYDIGEGVWHERDSNIAGYTSLRLYTVVNAFSDSGYKNPVAFNRINGSIYLLGGSAASPANSEAGTAIRRLRVFGPVEFGARWVQHSQIRFILDVQHDSSATYTLSADLEWSDNGGLTWTTARTMTKAVTSGTTSQRVMLQMHRLGQSRQRFYRLTLTGPAARIVLQSAELEYEIGGH